MTEIILQHYYTIYTILLKLSENRRKLLDYCISRAISVEWVAGIINKVFNYRSTITRISRKQEEISHRDIMKYIIP